MIELMIVVAIIGINACLAEARAYVNMALAMLNNGEAPPAAVKQACDVLDTVINLATDVTVTPRSPSVRSVICGFGNGSNCSLD